MKAFLRSINPFLVFSPFLLIYIFLVITRHSDIMEGDEGRYYMFAQNLLNGFYSPPAPDINLWNGPGYPLILTPFVFFNLPLVAIPLLNAVFQYVSIVLLFLAFRKHVSAGKALGLSLIWACYFIAFKEIAYILTEPFTVFLIASLLFCFSKIDEGKKYVYLSGVVFGVLVLTKIIFGYVLLALLAFTTAQFAVKKTALSRKLVYTFLLAFLINLPYLIYTYSLTGKLFYWGNSGGMSLYWMSTPFEHEYGDWNSPEFDAYCFEPAIPCNAHFFAKNHQADMNYVQSLPVIDQDDAYKELAIANIRNYPFKYLKNCIANVSRLFFNYPESYTFPREMTILRFFPNSILFTSMLLAFILTVYNRKKLESEIVCLLLILFLYLGASILVSATARQLNVVVPLILFWIGYAFYKLTTITITPANIS